MGGQFRGKISFLRKVAKIFLGKIQGCRRALSFDVYPMLSLCFCIVVLCSPLQCGSVLRDRGGGVYGDYRRQNFCWGKISPPLGNLKLQLPCAHPNMQVNAVHRAMNS